MSPQGIDPGGVILRPSELRALQRGLSSAQRVLSRGQRTIEISKAMLYGLLNSGVTEAQICTLLLLMLERSDGDNRSMPDGRFLVSFRKMSGQIGAGRKSILGHIDELKNKGILSVEPFGPKGCWVKILLDEV